MNVEVKKLDKLKRKIKVEVRGEDLSRERNEFYRDNSKNLKVPGFRPGNAPLDILEKYHGKILREEFLKKKLPEFYRKALTENEISPASMPRISDVELKNESLIFSAELEVKPEIAVKDSLYKGIKIKDTKVKIEEIEVEKMLTNLKEQIKKTTGQDLDDQRLARWSSYPDIDRLKSAVRARITLDKMRERRRKIEEQVRGHLLKSCKVDIPEGEVERYHKDLVNREVHNLQRRGVSADDIQKYRKEIEEKLQPLAREGIKLFYIFEAIAKAEQIKAGDNLEDIVVGLILSQAQY